MLLHAVFSAVLNMSITASIAILVILLARILLKRAPKIFSYVLWAVVLFRLLCPVSLTSQFSLMGLVPAPTTEAGRMEYVSWNIPHTERPAVAVDVPASDLNQTTDHGVEPPTVTVGETDSADVLISVVSMVWICGVAAMLMFHLLQLIRLRRNLIGSMPLKDNIYLADYIPTPFVMGLIRPKIYLPSAMSEAEQSYIIQHEKHHIHRGDHVIKLLAFAAVCIHWFNPLVWLAFVLSSRDMEMSCDEAVIKQVGRDIRADYSSSLLQFSTGKRVILGTPLAFGEGETKERIENIMRYKKPTMIIVVLAAVVCVGLTACLSSNPQPGAEGNSSLSNADTSQPQTDSLPENRTYTEADVQAAFARSDKAPNATILDCVVAEDQAMNLMGVVQYLDSRDPKTCWLGFVTIDGFVYSTGPQAKPADDDSLTYLGDGTASMNMIQEDTGETYLYKLTISRTDSGVLCYTSWDSRIQEETELQES